MHQPNPFSTPEASTEPTDVQRRDALRRLARVHRRVNLIVLANIVAVFALFAAGMMTRSSPGLASILSTAVTVFLLVSWVALIVSIYQLGRALDWSTIGCIAAVAAMFIGLVNLVVIIVAISSANTKLKQAGYRVGFLGVSPSDIT